MKRIRRGYRLDPLVDCTIKLLARETQLSEADIISFCVLEHANKIIATRNLLTTLSNSAATHASISSTILNSKRRMLELWKRETGDEKQSKSQN